MTTFVAKQKPHMMQKYLPFALLAALLFICFSIWTTWNHLQTEKLHREYVDQVTQVISHITLRLDSYKMLLQGAAGLFAVSEDVSRDQWRTYYEYRQIRTFFPGIQGFGYSRVVQPSELARHIQEIRTEGFPDYTVWPAGKRDVYTAIIFLEPFDRLNQRAFGYDMFSEPVRHAAMVRAGDTGSEAISGKVELVQETGKDIQAGFLMYIPVYAPNMPLSSIEERRAALKGYVYCPFRMNNLMGAIFHDSESQINFEIYDGAQVAPSALMYDSHDAGSSREQSPMFSSQRTLDLFGHQWTLAFETQPSFKADFSKWTSWGILLAGLLISLLVFFYSRMLVNFNVKVTSLADKMTLALRESEEKYRILCDTLPVGVSIIGPDMKILAANATKHRWFSESDFKEYSICYTVYNKPPLSEPCRECPVVKTFQDGQVHSAERQATTVLGLRSLYIVSVPIKDPDGKTSKVHETVEDITERKHMEQELRENEQRFRLLAQNSRDAIWTTDLEGRLTYMSPAIKSLTGYSADEVMKMQLNQFIADEDLDILMEILMAELAKRPEDRLDHIREEIRYKQKNGRLLNVEISAAWIIDAQGNPCGIQGCSRSLSDYRRAEKERIARLVAEAASRTKSQFVANMSHEIRTPMNAILGFTQLLERDPSLTPSQAEHVRTISRSGLYLLNLINDILDISKIEAGRVALNNEAFSLHDLLRDLEMMFRSRAEAKGLQILMERDEHIPNAVIGDEGKLRQVLINLMGNAVKFTERGGVAVRVRADTAREKTEEEKEVFQLEVEVEDTGPGIPGEDMDQLFVAFHQAEVGIKAGGTGLGLAISKDFVEIMGGRLTVTSQVGKGSCFRICVPLEESDDVFEQKKPAHRCVVGLEPGTGAYRILVVDDMPDNRLLVCKLLQPIGFEVLEAQNGVEALEIFEKWQPHAILMDMRMPEMDGYEAIRQLRATEAGRDVPIIAVTASVFEEQVEKILLTGVNAYLRKPYRVNELFDMLGDLLNLRYVFSDEADKTVGHSRQSSLTPESLAVLPGELIEAMRQALSEGDMARLKKSIFQTGTIDGDIARSLRGLADRYDYNKLNELLEKGDSDNE